MSFIVSIESNKINEITRYVCCDCEYTTTEKKMIELHVETTHVEPTSPLSDGGSMRKKTVIADDNKYTGESGASSPKFVLSPSSSVYRFRKRVAKCHVDSSCSEIMNDLISENKMLREDNAKLRRIL